DGTGELFVHFSAIAGEEGKFKTLNQDDEVEFEIVQGEKGKEARNVVVTKQANRKRPYRKKSVLNKGNPIPQEN
ncbi:MAG: cold-shock protein, partial [Promethearchaeota archaeon]